MGANNIEVKWESYTDAAYYKFSINPDSSSGAQTNYDYINKRVDGTSYVLDQPLAAAHTPAPSPPTTGMTSSWPKVLATSNLP